MTIKPLDIDHPRMPAISFFEFSHRSISASREERYGVQLTAHGLNVTRNLSIDDLREIRDWLDQVISEKDVEEADRFAPFMQEAV
jgi:hypothetical protein